MLEPTDDTADRSDDRRTQSPARRAWSIVAGILLVLVILGLLAAMWMPAIVGVQSPAR